MTTQLDASTLSLRTVHQLLNLERQLSHSFTPLLPLEPLTVEEQQDLEEICTYFFDYYAEGKISEGEIKFLTLSPLLWLAGFHRANTKIALEENIAPIEVKDEDVMIKGRMDIFIRTRAEANITTTPFWILLIESKNSTVNALEGLPQLLAYAYKSLEHQPSTWGLTTNGMDYQFVRLEAGNPATYWLFPKLDLIRPELAVQLLQVLKTIAKL